MPTRFLINQCQIIIFLILKYVITENSWIELRGIVLPVQVGWIIGEGGKWYVGPPSQIIWGGGLMCVSKTKFATIKAMISELARKFMKYVIRKPLFSFFIPDVRSGTRLNSSSDNLTIGQKIPTPPPPAPPPPLPSP